MWKINGLSRRTFLGLLSAVGFPSNNKARSADSQASALVNCGSGAATAATTGRAARGYKVFSTLEAATLGAMVEVIVPEDDFPGALRAGVVHYIDNALASDQSDKLNIYRAGVDAANDASRWEYGFDFAELSFPQQTALLKKIEHGEAPGTFWQMLSQEKFFRLLWRHTLEGYYGPPQYGGNKDYVSWKMVGYPELDGMEPMHRNREK